MNNEQLKKGNELYQLIKQTEKALDGLKNREEETSCGNEYYNDNTYWLSISKHRDKSGWNGELNRYYGNKQLLDVIIIELERQLTEFKNDFEKL